MKVVLYMAVSANGLIAKKNDDTSWISKKEWNSYSLVVRTSGNVVVGSRTYNILTKQHEFSEFKNVVIVVVSRDKNFAPSNHNHFVVRSPQDAISLLSKKGFRTALVAGGGKLNASFMREKLVDEIFLDIEPIVFGKGISLFAESGFESGLKLVETKKLSKNEIQLHYKVVK